MKICITGATGFVGRSLVLRLQRDGHEIVAITRNADRARDLLGRDVRLVELSELRDGHPPLALEGCDAVVNLAGAPVVGKRWTSKRRRELYDSRVKLTHRLVDCLAQLKRGPKVFVSGSAVGYYGHRVEKPVRAGDRPGPGFLADLCKDWEEAAMRAEEELEARVVCLRIGIVLGQDGGVLGKLLPIFRLGLGGKLGRGDQVTPWIHIADLVELINHAIGSEGMRGPVNAVHPAPVSNATFTQVLARAVGKPAFLPVPRPALYLLLGKQAAVVTAGQNAKAEASLANGFRFQFASITEAMEELVEDDKGCYVGKAEALPESSYLKARGATYELRQSTLVNAPLEEVFAFFSSAENLGILTPSSVDFAIDSESPIEMRPGAEIAYTIKIWGVPVRWKTEIVKWEPGVGFVDAQIEGPYKSWWHEHRFEARGNQTLMHDRVLYRMPLGLLGRFVHWLQVGTMLKDIFSYRTRMIERRFGAGREARAAA